MPQVSSVVCCRAMGLMQLDSDFRLLIQALQTRLRRCRLCRVMLLVIGTTYSGESNAEQGF